MAESGFIQEGVDRVQSALKTLDKEYRRIQKEADARLRRVERRAERQIKRLQAGIRRSPLAKPLAKRAEDVRRRVEEARSEAQSMFEGRVEAVLGTLKIATRTEIEKLDRKVALLHRKLQELEGAKPVRRAARPKRRARA